MPSIPSPGRKFADRFANRRHYFNNATPLARWRMGLSLAAFAAAAAWMLGAYFLKAERVLSHGPLAQVHGSLDANCAACHDQKSSGDLRWPKTLSAHERWHAFSCEGCHAGPKGDEKNYAPHGQYVLFPKDKPAEDCGACHRDHRGRDFSLVRLKDSDCTGCHADLEKYIVPDAPQDRQIYKAKIAAFVWNAPPNQRADDHPDFRGLKNAEKRTLKFNHARHLKYGIPLDDKAAKDNPSSLWKFDDISSHKEQYERYKAKDDVIQLDCAACHTPDASGKYYQPVTFEQHCIACHPLRTNDLATSQEPKISLRGFEIPHKLQPEQLNKFIASNISRQLVEGKYEPIKGLLEPSQDRLDPLDREKLKKFEDIINEVVRKTEGELHLQGHPESPLFGGKACGKCHEYTPDRTKIEKPNSPAIWLPQAKFSHVAHNTLDCTSCHPQKSKDGTPDRKLTGPDILGIESCVKCHIPGSAVRSDCTDCHRYHSGDDAKDGPASWKRGKGSLSIKEMLEKMGSK